MEAFADTTLASALFENLDVPSLYYIFSAEKQILPEEIQKGILALLQGKHALQSLYERFKLPVGELGFLSFFQVWKRKFLFSKDTPLRFLFEQRKIYSSTKVLCKAAKYRRFDFVDEFLSRKRLWCSSPHIQAICKGIFSSPLEGYDGVWHEEKPSFIKQKSLLVWKDQMLTTLTRNFLKPAQTLL